MKYLLPLASLLIVLLGGFFYFFKSHSWNGTAVSSADVEIPVRVARVRRISLPLKMKLTGELQPVNHTEVVSRLAGKVAEVRFKVGDFVPAGTVVATIRATDLDQRSGRIEAGVGAARADLQSREDDLAAIEKRLANEREFLRRDLIARRDVEQTDAAAQTARAQAELARAHLAQQQAMLTQIRALQSLTRLTAPISGEVGAVLIAPGAAVGEGGAIISLIGLDSLKLIARVSGADLPGLRPGAKARISNSSLPGKVLEGEIVRLTPQSSESDPAIEVEVHMNNRKKYLRPVMPVEASIDRGAMEDFLLIPRSAVSSQNKSSYVYKVTDNRAVRHKIVIGHERGEEVAVVQGLKQGEWVVAEYLSSVGPGTRVRPLRTEINSDANQR
jgi:multidrug efflux system membrane fusion protein